MKQPKICQSSSPVQCSSPVISNSPKLGRFYGTSFMKIFTSTSLPFHLTDAPLFNSVVDLCHDYAIPDYSLVLEEWQTIASKLTKRKIIPSCVPMPVHLRTASILPHTKVKLLHTYLYRNSCMKSVYDIMQLTSYFVVPICCCDKMSYTYGE